MKIKTFAQSFSDVYGLTRTDIKPLGAKLGKLMEEVGELAECVNIHQGFITHKTMKEPLAGEVADVVQCALAVLFDAYPHLSKKQAMELFLTEFERKNGKWAHVQRGDAARVAAKHQAQERPEESAIPESEPNDIDARVVHIVTEQLGLHKSDIVLDALIVDEYGADSLDLVELVMAIEDEFEFEISDRDAEAITTVRGLIAYVKARYGILEEASEDQSIDAYDDSIHVLREPEPAKPPHFDPADDYTERTGRHLSLSERVQERSLFNNKDKDNL